MPGPLGPPWTPPSPRWRPHEDPNHLPDQTPPQHNLAEEEVTQVGVPLRVGAGGTWAPPRRDGEVAGDGAVAADNQREAQGPRAPQEAQRPAVEPRQAPGPGRPLVRAAGMHPLLRLGRGHPPSLLPRGGGAGGRELTPGLQVGQEPVPVHRHLPDRPGGPLPGHRQGVLLRRELDARHPRGAIQRHQLHRAGGNVAEETQRPQFCIAPGQADVRSSEKGARAGPGRGGRESEGGGGAGLGWHCGARVL